MVVYSIKMVICNTYVSYENMYNVLPAFHVAFHFSSESDNIFPIPNKHLAGAQLKAFIRGNMVQKKCKRKKHMIFIIFNVLGILSWQIYFVFIRYFYSHIPFLIYNN